MNAYAPDTNESIELDDRTHRALTECMTVLPEGGDIYTVVGQHNNGEYQVDAREKRCTCADHRHRNVDCKHAKRVAFATGERPVPADVDGVFFTTRAALPHLTESDGHLVFVGIFAGQYPRPFNPVYAATKWAVRGFALSVEASVGPDGVAVTVVNPSEVRTEFGSELDEAFEDRFEPGEVTEPEEVADTIRFAVRQGGSTLSEIDIYRRDKLGFF